MKRIIVLVFISCYSLFANTLNISLDYNYNYKFEDFLFVDTNITEHLSTQENYLNLHLDGNYNNILGFEYDKSNLSSSDKFDTLELYIGNDISKYFSYKKTTQDIEYGSRNTSKNTQEFIFFNFYSLLKSDFSVSSTESFGKKISGVDTNLTVQVNRIYDLEINSFSSENFYDMVKNDAIKGKDYFYGLSISKNYNSKYRLYGIAILSYEKWDLSNGEAYYYDINGTKNEVKDVSDDDENKLIAVNGKFEGFSYGYKLTAEAYWEDVSIYLTAYTKKTILKNYHKGVKYKEPASDAPKQVIAKEKLTSSNNYLTLGIKYKF